MSDTPGQEIASRLGRLAGRSWAALGLYLAAALLLTWPVALDGASRLPLGSEPTPTVPYFNLWTLGWNASWLGAPDAGYWDAPVFHPTPGAFAFSDPQPLTGLLALPLSWIGGGAFAYNGVLWLFLVLNGVAMRRLLLHRGLGPLAAGLGGFLCMLLPFLTHERGVLQLQPLFGLIWALDETWRLLEDAPWHRGFYLGAAMVVTFTTSEYYGLFLPWLLAVPVLLHLRKLTRRDTALGLGVGVGVAALVLTPFLWSQARHLDAMGFERSASSVEKYSASPGDYLRRSPQTWIGDMEDESEATGAKYLFPGWVLVLLALWGAVRRRGTRDSRVWVLSLGLTASLAFVLSLGPRLDLGGWQPYDWVRAVVPGFSALRSPFRWAVVVQLSIAALAALGLARLPGRRRHLTALVLAALVVVELAPEPTPTVPAPAALEPGSVESPAVFVPYAAGRTTAHYLETVAVMNAVLPTHARLVNGYSGFFPAMNAQLRELLADFPTERGLRALEALGVRTLLVLIPRLDAEQRERLETLVRSGQLTDLGPRMELYALGLPGGELQPASTYPGRWDVGWRWRDEGLELRLTPRDPGEEIYVVAPETAPLQWRARWRGPGGSQGETPVSSSGSFLVYSGSRHAVHVTLPLPEAPGPYRVELLDPASGEPVARLGVPGRR